MSLLRCAAFRTCLLGSISSKTKLHLLAVFAMPPRRTPKDEGSVRASLPVAHVARIVARRPGHILCSYGVLRYKVHATTPMRTRQVLRRLRSM